MRPTRLAVTGYVVAVGVLAASGVASESTALILLAYLLALPAGLLALPGYYLAYGLLALVPGANPPSGELATWFQVTTTVLGVLAPVAAALVNLVLLRLVLRRRRPLPVDDDSPFGVPGC